MKKVLLLNMALLSGVVHAQDNPNIIVFLVDDMGLMDTSVPFIVNGEGKTVRQPLNNYYHTPNMEVLAEQGIRFSNFYAQNVSSPSRVSIMTGQSAARHRTTNWINPEYNNRDDFGPFEWNWKGLSSDTPTYPKLLKESGYKTIHIGKAHFGCIGSDGEDPLNIGFEVNIGGSSIGHPGSYYGAECYGKYKNGGKNYVPHLEKYHGTDTFLTEALTIEACNEIEKCVKDNIPFYLNMAHYAVHAPFNADKRFIDNYKNDTEYVKGHAFASLIEGMDKSLGDIMDKLNSLGIAENTLIIFWGDNGSDSPLGEADNYGSSAPLRGKKGSEYEGGVRIPFIVSWGKIDRENKFQKKLKIASNTVQTQMANIMDIYPTILSVADIDKPGYYTVDGRSLEKLLTGKKDRKHPNDFLVHFPHNHRGSYFTSYIDGEWKLIYYYNPDKDCKPSYKLYNIKDDPFEEHDLSTKNRDLLRKICHKMKTRLKKENALMPVDKNGKQIDIVLP